MHKRILRFLSVLLCAFMLIPLALPVQATAQKAAGQDVQKPSENKDSSAMLIGDGDAFQAVQRTDADRGGTVQFHFDPADAPEDALSADSLAAIAVLSMTPLDSFDDVTDALAGAFESTHSFGAVEDNDGGIYFLPVVWSDQDEAYVYGLSGKDAAGEDVTFSLPQYFIWNNHDWVQQYLCVFPNPESSWKIAGYGDGICIPVIVSANEEGGNDLLFDQQAGATEDLDILFAYGTDAGMEPPAVYSQSAPDPISASDFNFSAHWESCGQDTSGNWQTDSLWDTASVGYANAQLGLRYELSFNANKDYAAGQVKLYFPYYLFAYRDASTGPELTSADKLSLQNLQGWSLTETTVSGTRYWLLTNTDTVSTGKQVTIPVEYGVDPMQTVDGAVTKGKFTLDVKVEAGEDTASQTLSGAVKTGVQSVQITKTPDNLYSQDLTESYAGQVMSWTADLSKYGINQQQFEADQASYYYMEYILTVNLSGNQPCTLQFQEQPGQSGVVVGATYGSGTVSSESMDEQYGVLVKFPKSSAGSGFLSNVVNITATGVDGDPVDVKTGTDTANHSWVSAAADYTGQIFFLGKGARFATTNGFGSLKDGTNVDFQYWVYGGAKSYAYSKFNSAHPEYLPLKLELIDDALFFSGYDASGSVAELGSGDYAFTSVDIALEDRKNVTVGPDGELSDRGSFKAGSELGSVSIYVIDKNHSTWTLYKTVSVPCSVVADESPESFVSVSLTDQGGFDGVYRVKVVYDKSTEYTEMLFYLHGTIYANGPKVKSSITAATGAKLDHLTLTNWAALRAYEKNGTGWLDATDPNDITTDPASLKDALLALDKQLYPETAASPYTSFRQVSAEVLGTQSANVGAYIGGMDEADVTATFQGDHLILSGYGIAAEMMNIGRQDNVGDLNDYMQHYLENNQDLYKARGVILYMLLPSTHKLLSMQDTPYNDIKNVTEGTMQKQDGTIPWSVFSSAAGHSWSGIIRPGVDDQIYTDMEIQVGKGLTSYHMNPALIVDSNYKNSGYQLVKIQYDFDLGGGTYFTDGADSYMASIRAPVLEQDGMYYRDPRMIGPGGGFAFQVQIDYDMLYLHPSFSYYLAAQFTDEDGNVIDYGSMANAQADDGAYNELMSGGQHLLSDLDGDGDTAKHSVVFGSAKFTFNVVGLTVTDIEKSVMADGVDAQYGSTTTVEAGNSYTYRLFYACSDGQAEDVVLLDTIEEAYGSNNHWKGTLAGVDLSEAASLGVNNISVWVNKTHAYTDSELITDGQSGKEGFKPSDLTAENGWEKIDPSSFSDWASVLTIAFDMRGVTFSSEGPRGVAVYLKMTAPSTVQAADAKAYNRVNYYSTHTPAHGSKTSSTNLGNVVTVDLDASKLAPSPSYMAISKHTSADRLWDSGEMFTFQVRITNADGTPWNPEGGTVSYGTAEYPWTSNTSAVSYTNTVPVTDGKFSISITFETTAVIKGVPSGAHFTVTEDQKPGYVCVSSTHDSGTILPVADNAHIPDQNWAIFLNSPGTPSEPEQEMAHLIIGKNIGVWGGSGLSLPEDAGSTIFTFHITFTDGEGQPWNPEGGSLSYAAVDYQSNPLDYDISDSDYSNSIQVVDGKVTITIQARKAVIFKDIPIGTHYSVTEDSKELWETGYMDYPEGEITKEQGTERNWVNIQNVYVGLNKSFLVVEKEMLDGVADPDDPNKEFEFTITLKTEDGENYTGTLDYDIFNVSDYQKPDGSLDLSSFQKGHVSEHTATLTDGSFTVKLKAGQFLITNPEALTVGTQFTVSETGGLGGRYSLSSAVITGADNSSTSGTSASGTLTEDGSQVKFINKWIPPLDALLPDTGGTGTTDLFLLGIWMLCVSTLTLAIILHKTFQTVKRKRYLPKH